MTDEQEKICQLIVRQRPSPGQELAGLLKTLQAEFGLETYTARQRLTGPALAMFGQGSRRKTGQIADLLRQHGFACWLVPAQKPRFAPDRLRGLEIQPDHVLFHCQNGPVRLERGASVVAVLADLSGGLSDRYFKRLLARNAYQGSDSHQIFCPSEIEQAVFKGQPVYAFYLLAEPADITQAVLVLPGRFDIEGLAGRAGLSTLKNLQAVIGLVQEYAGAYRVHHDFGLSHLPDCQVLRQSDNPSAAVENLHSLTRYGWLVARLQGDGLLPPASAAAETDLVAAVGATAAVGQPVLGAVTGPIGGDQGVPGLAEVAAEIRTVMAQEQAEAGKRQDTAVQTAADQGLPPPPDRPAPRVSLQRVLLISASVLAGLLVALFSDGLLGLLRPVVRSGSAAGLLPGIFSLGLFWLGIYYFRLRRRMANTPTSKVRSIAMGMVEIHGRARRLYALVAPMTQSPCVFYRLRKYRRDRNKKWKLVRQIDSRHVPFQVDDGSGRVTIDPAGAAVRAKTRQTGYPGESRLLFNAFKREYENEKWVEDIVYEGTSLYVLGYARPLKQESSSLAERTRVRLRALKLDPQALRGYDTDGDGRISETEWDQARNDAEQTALREHLGERGRRRRQEEHVVIARPRQRGLPFIIAEAVSEAHLTRRYALISVPALLGGFASLIFAICMLLEYLQH